MAEEYDVQAIMNALKEKEEMDPDKHDGCYELMRETIDAYSKMKDLSVLDYKDLNLVYLTTIGTWKQGIESKKKTVMKSHLPLQDKEFLVMLWDEIWEKAGREEYSNYELNAAGDRSIGMFGTGFFSFQRTTTDAHVRRFIRMCVDIFPMTDDNEMFDRAERVLATSFQGMKAASASMILHCLKPYTFPILNSNMGNRSIFEVLGVDLIRKNNIETYIDNCRKIKEFRDRNFSCKNYRIFDIASWKVNEYVIKHPVGQFGSWEIVNENIVRKTCDKSLFQFREIKIPQEILWFFGVEGLQTGRKQELVFVYEGFEYDGHILRESVSPAETRISWDPSLAEEFEPFEDDGLHHLLEFRRDGENKYALEFIEPVSEKESDVIVQFDHNMILYGPPGTGKTYNSVIYAVAICEGRAVWDVMKEPYPEILRRYRKLQDVGRIAFTTFHQSYSYEEFIEGIKPRLNSGSGTLGYTIEDGVFKDFCNRAKAVKVHFTTRSLMKQKPRIWGMILGGTGVTDLKKQCFTNNEIRLGWIEVDDDDIDGDFEREENNPSNVKHMIYDFKNSMEIGDLVVIEKSNKSIDAIGVITGEYEYDKSTGKYPRRRSVEWLVKDIDQNIVQFLPKGMKQLSRFSLFAFDYIGMDVISCILNENSHAPIVEIIREMKPYVFIIDEINRGNISKIFGELITLIEDTKREGASEAMEALLPYSGEPFSVPRNVYILGTMNTADRSIALMDTALRRRFEFIEMMPDSEVLDSLGVGTICVNGDELKVARMLDLINERIEYLFDREHTIGHAFFTKLADDPSFEALAGIFEKNVIPLLQEYFYEDYEKIQLVLGDNAKEDEYKFVLDKPLKFKDIFNGNPDIDLPEKGYVIQRDAFLKLESYKQIGRNL